MDEGGQSENSAAGVEAAASGPARTGVPGLDDVLGGGLDRARAYLLEGDPGTGKTTLALRFLIEGAAAGERCLYITLAETEDELRAASASHGWSLAGLDIHELAPPESLLDEEQQQSLLYSSDLELGETTKRVFAAFERSRPNRVVLDSLSEIRLLAQSSLRYRRQILAMKHYFARQGATVMMLDDLTTEALDKTVHSVAHGVLRLEELSPEYGAERRRLRVVKYRGKRYPRRLPRFRDRDWGLARLPSPGVRRASRQLRSRQSLPTGLTELDALLGGGLDRGSSVLVLGPAGAGKSLFALTCLQSAVQRGERAAMFAFDEERGLLTDRAKALGIDLAAMEAADRFSLEQVDAAELTPGEFSERVRRSVEVGGARTVLIDSLNGYNSSMPGERALLLHMHELLQYLNRRGVTTILTLAQHGLVGAMTVPVDVTYIADTVILLRYFEARGRMRRAISVVKKRAGPHEDTIREFQIGGRGISLGPPLTEFQGVLTGVPTIVSEADLLDRRDA